MTDMERTDRRTDNGVQSVTDLLYGRSQNRVIKLDDFVSFNSFIINNKGPIGLLRVATYNDVYMIQCSD